MRFWEISRNRSEEESPIDRMGVILINIVSKCNQKGKGKFVFVDF